MLGKTLLLLTFQTYLTSVVKVSTEKVELNGNEQLNNEDSNNSWTGEEYASDQIKEEGAENQIKEEDAENLKEIGDTNEPQEAVKHRKKVKMDDVSDKKFEPGFELTPEEMQRFKIWKNGVIPYFIDEGSFDKVLRDKIRNYLHMVNSITSLNFMELPNLPSNDDERWVFFLNRRGLLGCAVHSVNNFTNQGIQPVVLGYDCLATKGELAEAVMSIAGVPAQHNAPDRDKHITIHTENIMPGKIHLFEKLNDNEWLFHDLKYDFKSITHYDIHKYSTNGRVTIQLKKYSKDINPARALSHTDILKIKRLYNYITRNKNLQVPDCQKLFEPRNNLEGFIPAGKEIKPRKKHSRYTGLMNAEEGIIEDEQAMADDGLSYEEEEVCCYF